MFNWLMNPIYNIISWVLLRWHDVWAAILPHGRFLGTTSGPEKLCLSCPGSRPLSSPPDVSVRPILAKL